MGYDGQDMHHKIYVSVDSAAPTVTLSAGVDGTNWFVIDTGLVGTGTGEVSVLVTGNVLDLPYKFVKLEVSGGNIDLAVDSFGTVVR